MFSRLIAWIYLHVFGLTVPQPDRLEALEAQREELLALYIRLDELLCINRQDIDAEIDARIEAWRAQA